MRRPAEPDGDFLRTEAALFRELLEHLDVKNGELPQSGNPSRVLATRNDCEPQRFVSRHEKFPMLMTRGRRPAIRTLRGWAINVLNEAGAIRECENHGWMLDRADPHARERASDIAREDPPPEVSSQSAAVAIAEVLDSIGDTCPECPPPAGQSGAP